MFEVSPFARAMRFPVAICLGLLISVAGCRSKKTPPPAKKGEFTEGILAAVKSPGENQFEKPEAAVRFLLEQVIAQNLSEATRVFPVKEYFEKNSLTAHVRHQRMYDYPSMPLKGARAHNIVIALEKLEIYDTVSLMLLDFDLNQRLVLRENDPDKHVEEITKKIDTSEIAKWKIARVGKQTEGKIADHNYVEKAIGATEVAVVTAVMENGNKEHSFTFDLIKIGTNWRIRSLQHYN